MIFKAFLMKKSECPKFLTWFKFWNINEETKWASNTLQTDIVNAAAKQKGQEMGGENDSEIHTVIRRSLNSSQKQAIMTNYF
jgi:hypothetical protein